MKQVILFLIFCFSIPTALFSQNSEKQQSTRKTTKSTVKNVSIPDKDWQWKDNQWLYKGKPTNMFPAFYTETETIEETIEIDGKTHKSYYQTQIEVHTQYETEMPDWRWNGAKWEYRGEEVESFPPQYTMKKTEKKTESVMFE
jgi:hypothetical protein